MTSSILARRSSVAHRTVAAAVLGNALEWYDFILYALFAGSIAATFFPADTPTDSLLLAVATFGAGFLLRPLGALVLGQYADRRGRRAAMSLIMLLMTVATALLTFTPSFHRIGLAAPLLIVFSRLLQGFSVGGELGSSTALLIESAPSGRRGLYASLQGSSQFVASLAASCAGLLVTRLMDAGQLAAWGWRVPFGVGLLIGPVGMYIRTQLHEPPAIERALRPEATPLRELWGHHRGAVLRVVGLISLGTMCTYILSLSMPTYAQRELGIPAGDAFLSEAIASLVAIVTAPLFGAWSDRVGARQVILPFAILTGVLIYPGFVLLARVPTAPMLIVLQGLGLLLVAAISGPAYGLIGSLFPPQVRSSGLSVGYNISVLLFGGFAPFITTKLIALTHDKQMPAAYVMLGAVLSVAALLVGWPRGQRLPAGPPGSAESPLDPPVRP